jgi:hypothetical protein
MIGQINLNGYVLIISWHKHLNCLVWVQCSADAMRCLTNTNLWSFLAYNFGGQVGSIQSCTGATEDKYYEASDATYAETHGSWEKTSIGKVTFAWEVTMLNYLLWLASGRNILFIGKECLYVTMALNYILASRFCSHIRGVTESWKTIFYSV